MIDQLSALTSNKLSTAAIQTKNTIYSTITDYWLLRIVISQIFTFCKFYTVSKRHKVVLIGQGISAMSTRVLQCFIALYQDTVWSQ